MKRIVLLGIFVGVFLQGNSKTIEVGAKCSIKKIKVALAQAKSGDTVLVLEGIYKEGTVVIDKAIVFLGRNNPKLDGQKKFEVLAVKSNNVQVTGFTIQNSGCSSFDDPGGIKVYNSNNVLISDNYLYNNFFGIYIQYGSNCIIKKNTIVAFGVDEQQTGNGIHCWKSDSLQIIANTITGHRDGIYFEFVTNSIIWRNLSQKNVRYGLHFMFSNSDAYISNIFRNNGAGVAVMFTHKVKMFNNYFEKNWGDASYGLLLKEISDSYISGNKFLNNTIGIYMEGTSRLEVNRNVFKNNGWGMKIQASCMENNVHLNNFMGNSFDISTNGSLVLNKFDMNYWDKYEGYDLDKNSIVDVHYHPLSIFSLIVENNPPAMLLYRSFIVTLLDKSEKLIPSLTPENFIDNSPQMYQNIL